MNVLKEKLRNDELTKTETLIGEYVLDHPDAVCFMKVTDIAQKLEVSESSIIRFCQAIGYSGYVTFQKRLQKQYRKNTQYISNTITVPAERLVQCSSFKNDTDSNFVEVHFQNALHNMESVMLNNSQAQFTKAAQIITASKKKYIVASRANTGQGDYCLLYMKHMMNQVISASYGAIHPIDHLCDIEKEDCVIVYSFPRYSDIDKQAIQMAFDKGAQIIVITDKKSAPIAQYASILFVVDVDSNTFFNSYTGVQLISELLCDAISQHLGLPVEDRLKQIDQYLSPLGAW